VKWCGAAITAPLQLQPQLSTREAVETALFSTQHL